MSRAVNAINTYNNLPLNRSHYMNLPGFLSKSTSAASTP